MYRRLLVAVLLCGVAIVEVLNVQAMRTAQPTNASRVTLVTTDQAALAVEAGPGNLLQWVTITGGRLAADLTQSGYGAGYTMELDSTYRFRRLIRITNRGTSIQSVSLRESGGSLGTLQVTGELNGGSTVFNPPFQMRPGDYVLVTISYTPSAEGQGTLFLEVNAY